MNKKSLCLMFAALVLTCLSVGCGSDEPENYYTIGTDNIEEADGYVEGVTRGYSFDEDTSAVFETDATELN